MPYKKKPCPVCSELHSNKEFCSRSCAGTKPRNRTIQPKTKKCEKCGELFTTEKGKIRLQSRKYCLSCSPFKKRIKGTKEYFFCQECNQNLPKDAFYLFKDNKTKKYNKCKKCNWKYEYFRKRQKKQELIDYAGGCCSICGYNKSTYALEFHHIDENGKDFNVSGKLLSPKVKEEIKKCKLVCSNCHRELHEQILIKRFSN